MADGFKLNIEVDVNSISDKINSVVSDPQTMTEIHEAFARYMHRYIPQSTGTLADSAEVTAEYVRYPGPYAHYQYMGQVYGPNFIGWLDFATPGWRSIRGMKKYPTGRELGKPGHATFVPQFGKDKSKELIDWDFGYSTPGTRHHWDKKMMEERGDDFRQEVAAILARRANELYG